MTPTMTNQAAPAIKLMPIGVKGGLGYESAGGAQKLGYYLLIAFIVLVFSRIADFAPYYLHLPLVTSASALGFCVLTRGLERSMQTRIGLLLLAFTGWMLMGLPFSAWRGGTWGLFTDLWVKSLLCYFLVSGLVLTSKDVRGVMKALAFCSVIIVILARVYKHVDQDGRLAVAGGTLSNPNDMAQLVLVGMPFLYLIATTSHVVGKAYALIALPLAAYTVVATGSRGAFMAIVAMAGYVFWKASTGGKIKGIFAFVALVGAAVIFVPGQLRDRYRTTFSNDASQLSDAVAVESRQQRWELLKQSIKFTITRPIFGVGAGQFTTASKAESNSQGRAAMWRETHNAYTQVSAETGVPGFCLYFGCVVIAFKLINRLKRATKNLPRFQLLHKTASAMYLSLLSFAVTSMFSSVAYGPYLPALLGLAVALYQAAVYELGVAGVSLTPAKRPLFQMAPRRVAPVPAPALGPLAPARRG